MGDKRLLQWCELDLDQRSDLAERFKELGYECEIVGCNTNTKAAEINLSKEGISVGRVKLLPLDDGKNLNILGIHTQLGRKKQQDFQNVGVGKDILRTVISFALGNDFDRLTTSIFSKTGTGFFLSQGFHSTSAKTNFKEIDPITPAWERARGTFTDACIENYRDLFDPRSTQSALELARSPIGKVVVFNSGGCGCIELRNPEQLAIVNDILFGVGNSTASPHPSRHA